MTQEYFNLYRDRMETWRPDQSSFWYAFKEGQDGRDGELSYQPAFGAISTPYAHAECAQAGIDRLPWPAHVKARLRLVRAPCAFSRPDCWIDVDPPAEPATMCAPCAGSKFYM